MTLVVLALLGALVAATHALSIPQYTSHITDDQGNTATLAFNTISSAQQAQGRASVVARFNGTRVAYYKPFGGTFSYTE